MRKSKEKCDQLALFMFVDILLQSYYYSYYTWVTIHGAMIEQHQNGVQFARSSHDLAMSLSVTLTLTPVPPPVLNDLPVNCMATDKVCCG